MARINNYYHRDHGEKAGKHVFKIAYIKSYFFVYPRVPRGSKRYIYGG